VSVYDLPAAPQATRARAPSAPPAPSAAQGDGMDAELALLRAARAALRAGDATGALDTIARYEAEFPNGNLRPEAAALAVNAEIAAGRPDDARRRADAFLARYPDSPLAPRVRKARDETSAP
jgi:outer membrane protein assembly factor BamD (BamD/ComL family)